MRPTDASLLLAAGVAVIGGCAAQAPQRSADITVYQGPRDPAYAMPPELRVPPRTMEWRIAQARFQQEAEPVQRAVERDPAFGGFILRWHPEPHAVVMFTGDAEARLRRYTSDPRFRAQRVELTLAQLERMKDAFGAELQRLGLSCFTVDGDEEHNSVTVAAPAAELSRIRAAIAARTVRAPPKLRLQEQGCPTFR